MTQRHKFLGYLIKVTFVCFLISSELVGANDFERELDASVNMTDSERYELQLKLWERRDTNPEDWIKYCLLNRLDFDGNPLPAAENGSQVSGHLGDMPPHIREQYLTLKAYQDAGSDKVSELIQLLEMLYLE